MLNELLETDRDLFFDAPPRQKRSPRRSEYDEGFSDWWLMQGYEPDDESDDD